MSTPNLKIKIKIAVLAGFAALVLSGPLQHIGLMPQTAVGNASKAVLKSMKEALLPPAFAACEGIGALATGGGSSGAITGSGAGNGSSSDLLPVISSLTGSSAGTGAGTASASANGISIGSATQGSASGTGQGSTPLRVASSVSGSAAGTGAGGTASASGNGIAIGSAAQSPATGTGHGSTPLLVASSVTGSSAGTGAGGTGSVSGNGISVGSAAQSPATGTGPGSASQGNNSGTLSGSFGLGGAGSGSAVGSGSTGQGVTNYMVISPAVAGAFARRDEDKPLVLVVDAKADELDRMRRVLQFDGYAVLAATNAKEGLELFGHYLPRLVLVDPALPPENDGLEFARELRKAKNGANAVLVAMTARAHDEEQNDTIAAGFDAYLAKPLNLADLRQAIYLAGRSPTPTANNQETGRPAKVVLSKAGRFFYSPAASERPR